ncbi:MAG: putative rane protein [Cryptosporangiaceae bacterium]|jgi:membrane-associated protein|nr:putative rane protein [Cryptosporangiaceae bacterium]
MSAIVDGILTAPPVLVYVLVVALVFAEDALFVGFVIPGETAAILAGVDASRGHVALWGVALGVVLAAIVGDSVGYEIGRTIGPRVLDRRLLRRHRGRLAAAQDFLARRGGWAVFLGRFIAFFRAVMPALAGTARMPYRRFLLFNALGGLVWGLGSVGLGYGAGSSYRAVEHTVGRGAALVAATAVVLGVLLWRVREHRVRQGAD